MGSRSHRSSPLPRGVRIVRVLDDVESARAAARVRAIAERDARPIWNGDARRLMCELPSGDELHARFDAALRRARVLAAPSQRARLVVLRSLRGCVRQGLHTDYPMQAAAAARPKPRGALLALEHRTRLVVQPAHAGAVVLLDVPVGACVVFDGDVVHAGAEYAEDNVRVHAYLDVPNVRRRADTVWAVQRKRGRASKSGDEGGGERGETE